MSFFPDTIKIFKKSSIFNKLLLFFILLIFISVLIVGLFSYIISSKLLVTEVNTTNKLILEQAGEKVENKLASLKKLSLQIASGDLINKGIFVKKNYSVEDAMLFRDIIKYLTNIRLSNEVIDNVFIYYSNSDIIISNEGKYENAYYFNEIIKYNGISDTYWMDSFQCNQSFQVLGSFNVIYNGFRKKYITIIRNYKLNEEDRVAVVINIKAKELTDIFTRINDDNNNSFYILNKRGIPLVSYNNSEFISRNRQIFLDIFSDMVKGFTGDSFTTNKKIINNNFHIIGNRSSSFELYYLSIMPTSYITSKTNVIKKFTLISAMISILCGLIISYILTKNIYNPINKIINYINIMKNEKIDSETGKKNELVFINNIIDQIYIQKNRLQQSLNRSLPMIKEKFVEDLLHGKYKEEEIDNNLDTLDLDLNFNSFQVIIFEKTDVLDQDNRVNIIKEFYNYIEKINFSKLIILLSEGENGEIISLINIDISNNEEIAHFIESVKEYFSKKYGIKFTAGVGNTCQNIKKIPESYKEALLALQYKVIKGQGETIHIDEIDQLSPLIFEYPLEKERKIINYVKAGDRSSVKELVSGIIYNNLSQTEISPEMVENLFNALAGTAIRTVYEINSSLEEIYGKGYNIYSNLCQCNILSDKTDYIISVFNTIINFYQKNKKNRYEKIFNQIQDFIEKNYKEDISLNQIADEIGYSSSYISIIFKDYSGTYFVDYLNSFRVTKAKEIFNKQNISVRKTAKKVGFNSSQHFIRVFKKIEGITPGQYKK